MGPPCPIGGDAIALNDVVATLSDPQTTTIVISNECEKSIALLSTLKLLG